MKSQRFFSLLSAFILSLSFAAFAKAPSKHNVTAWQGAYIGPSLGVGWNETDFSYQNANYFNTLGAARFVDDFTLDPVAAVGGVSGGYYFQKRAWVVGLNGSILGAGLDDVAPSVNFPTLDRDSMKLNLLTSLALRIGHAYKSWLPYVGFGWAGGDIDVRMNDFVNNVTANSSFFANGWTVGFGVSYKLQRNLAFDVSYNYDYLYLTNRTVNCPTCGSGVGLGTPVINAHIKTQTVLASFNYFFMS